VELQEPQEQRGYTRVLFEGGQDDLLHVYLGLVAPRAELIHGIIEVSQGGAPMIPIVAAKVLKLFAQRGSTSTKSIDFHLTDREVEILRYLVDGYSYKMIADKCGVSYATVNTHVSHNYVKLQVKSMAGAVGVALREGLVGGSRSSSCGSAIARCTGSRVVSANTRRTS